MKLLVLSFYYQPDLSAGSFRTTALVQALKEHAPDLEIKVITTLPNRYQSFDVDAPEHEYKDGVSITRIVLPSHKSGMVDQSKAFLYFAHRAIEIARRDDYDLVYATSSRLMTAVLGANIARQKKCPLYLDIRDIFVDTIKDVLPRHIAGPSRILFSFLERLAINSAISVNLVSEGFRKYFEQYYSKQRFTFFTNGVDDEFLAETPKNESPVKLHAPLSVIYAGNLGEGQGLHHVLPALAGRSVGQLNFKVLGDGGRRTELLERLAKVKVTNVEVSPPIPRPDLIKEYLNADILFLHLGNYDAFTKVLPSKIFEYAALGKPIWAGVPGYAAEFLRQEVDNAAVFPPCDVGAAMESLDKLIIQDKPRREFIEKYSRSAICRKMSADILMVLNG